MSTIVGVKYNHLTVQKDLGLFKNGMRKVMAICDCGVVKAYYLGALRSGTTKSCGCLRLTNGRNLKKHGLANHPLINIWAQMRQRCNNPHARNYKNYGGRGVRICDEWNTEDFLPFYKWAIGAGWKTGLQIDKDTIPRKLGIPALLYSPEMCQFVTCRANQNAKRSNVIVHYNGQSLTVSEWATKINMPYYVLRRRIKKGWTAEKAFTYPIRKSAHAIN